MGVTRTRAVQHPTGPAGVLMGGMGPRRRRRGGDMGWPGRPTDDPAAAVRASAVGPKSTASKTLTSDLSLRTDRGPLPVRRRPWDVDIL